MLRLPAGFSTPFASRSPDPPATTQRAGIARQPAGPSRLCPPWLCLRARSPSAIKRAREHRDDEDAPIRRSNAFRLTFRNHIWPPPNQQPSTWTYRPARANPTPGHPSSPPVPAGARARWAAALAPFRASLIPAARSWRGAGNAPRPAGTYIHKLDGKVILLTGATERDGAGPAPASRGRARPCCSSRPGRRAGSRPPVAEAPRRRACPAASSSYQA